MINVLRDLKEVTEAYEFCPVREIVLPTRYYEQAVNCFPRPTSYTQDTAFALVIKGISISPCPLLSDCGIISFSNGRQPYLFKIGGTNGQKEETI